MSKSEWIDDKMEGKYIENFENGNIRLETEYKKSLQDGKTIVYYEKGRK